MPLHDAGGSPRLRRFLDVAVAEGLGDSVLRTLLPMTAVTSLGAGTGFVGTLNALGLVAFMALSAPIGAWSDAKANPTQAMQASSLSRAVVAVSLAAFAWFGLPLGSAGTTLLIMAAFAVGIADVVFTTNQGLLAPRLVAPDQLRGAFGKLQTTRQAAGAAGPLILAGFLIVLSPAAAWGVVAAFYVVSAGLVARLRPPGASDPSPVRPALWDGIRGGWSKLWSEPTLATVTVADSLINASVMAANTLLPVIVLTELGLSPATFAVLGGLGAAAAIAGSAVAAALTQRLGLRCVKIITSLTTSAGAMIVTAVVVPGALPGPAFPWLGLQAVLAGLSTSIALVAGSDLPARLTPPEALGAVMGSQRALTIGVMPISALLFGFIGSVGGLSWATALWTVLSMLAVVPSARLPSRA